MEWVFTKRDYYQSPLMMPDLAALKKNVELARELGFVKGPLEVEKFADLSLIQEAAKRLKLGDSNR